MLFGIAHLIAMWYQPFINNLFHEILISLSYMYLLYGSQLLLPDYYMLLSVLFAHLQVCEYFCVVLLFFLLFFTRGSTPIFQEMNCVYDHFLFHFHLGSHMLS